jgi:RNA polymerase sigma-70 factor (ECF subfamily)
MVTDNTPTASNQARPVEAGLSASDRCPLSQSSVLDDKALLDALRAGHEWAFEMMVRLFGGRLLAVARRFTRNDDDARDVLQSAYLSAFRALGDFEGACQLSTWLHRIVVNTALMRLRSRRRKPEESIEALLPVFQPDGHHVEQFSDWNAPADQLLEQQQTRATVRACIQQLPENYRAVLVLRDIEELSTEEAAAMLSMTPTAVKVRLHRARQALSTLLRKEYARPVTSRAPGHQTGRPHARRSISD